MSSSKLDVFSSLRPDVLWLGCFETFSSLFFKHRANPWRSPISGDSISSLHRVTYFEYSSLSGSVTHINDALSLLSPHAFVKRILVRHSVTKIRLLHRDPLDVHRLVSDLRHNHVIDLTYTIPLLLRIKSQLTSRTVRRSVTYLQLSVWYSAQKDRSNYTVPMIQGNQSRIPLLRRTQIERYLQQELFIRSIFVWRARDPLQWVRVSDTRTISRSNRIVSQTHCYWVLLEKSRNLRTSGFHFKCSLITPVDPK